MSEGDSTGGTRWASAGPVPISFSVVVLAKRNVSDFHGCGVEVVNPFED